LLRIGPFLTPIKTRAKILIFESVVNNYNLFYRWSKSFLEVDKKLLAQTFSKYDILKKATMSYPEAPRDAIYSQ
jgi:hypothetical protein